MLKQLHARAHGFASSSQSVEDLFGGSSERFVVSSSGRGVYTFCDNFKEEAQGGHSMAVFGFRHVQGRGFVLARDTLHGR